MPPGELSDDSCMSGAMVGGLRCALYHKLMSPTDNPSRTRMIDGQCLTLTSQEVRGYYRQFASLEYQRIDTGFSALTIHHSKEAVVPVISWPRSTPPIPTRAGGCIAEILQFAVCGTKALWATSSIRRKLLVHTDADPNRGRFYTLNINTWNIG